MSVLGTSLTVRPGVEAKSRTDPVGMPPLQKNASILSSFRASTDCAAPKLCLRMSASGFRPTASSTRRAVISVPLPGAPVDTMRSRRSVTDSMPLPSRVTNWFRLS